MITHKFEPDPSDLTHSTIQQLFYRQIRNLTTRSSLNEKMNTFDVQFSDTWF